MAYKLRTIPRSFNKLDTRKDLGIELTWVHVDPSLQNQLFVLQNVEIHRTKHEIRV